MARDYTPRKGSHPPPRPWEETLELARRVNVPAVRFRDREPVDEYWPPRLVDGHLQGRRVA